MSIRNLSDPAESISYSGDEPVIASRFALGSTTAAIHAAIGVAVNDLWELKGGDRQDLSIDVRDATASLLSFLFFSIKDEQANAADAAAFAKQRQMQMISTPHPTKDGRYFLPHVGLPHLAQRIFKVLKCDESLESVVAAVAKWDALDLENAIAEVNGCGAMVRSESEWLAHPQGKLLAGLPVIQIDKIADGPQVPMPGLTREVRPLSGIKVLDLTRILAGPTCARTLAEHGANVLMVTAEQLPQSDRFVKDTSHGKRSCFLDFSEADQRAQMVRLIKESDVFSQGYRPGVMERFGFSPEALAEINPGIIYTSMNCYGFDGPFATRAGWEQLAQTVTGIADEQGDRKPQLLPAAACDYSTGYLAAYGTLLAMRMRAEQGGSYHVRASLCQSAMFLQDQPRVDVPADLPALTAGQIQYRMQTAHSPYGEASFLGPVLDMSKTRPRWELPSPELGMHEPTFD